MHENLPFNVHQPSSLLWGLSTDQLTKVLVPTMIAGGVISALAFAVIAVFARKWRTGFVVLGIGLFLEAIPIVALGLRTGGTVAEVVAGVLKIWLDLIPVLLIFFGLIAWFLRSLWDDMGQAFELALSRWGLRGPIIMIAGSLLLFALFDTVFVFLKHR